MLRRRLLRGRPGPRHGDLHEEHHRGDQQARPIVAYGRRLGRPDDDPRAPLQRPAVARQVAHRAHRRPARRGLRPRRPRPPARRPPQPGGPARRVVRVQRHRRGAADPRHRPPGARGRPAGPGGCRSARTAPTHRHAPARRPRTPRPRRRCPPTSCTRRSGAARSSGAATDSRRSPDHCSGGTVNAVTLADIAWVDLPDRDEAGSPIVLGAVAFAAACRALGRHRMVDDRRQRAGVADPRHRRPGRHPGSRGPRPERPHCRHRHRPVHGRRSRPRTRRRHPRLRARHRCP